MDPAASRTEPTDRQLASLAKTGDGEALEQLASRWWPTVRRWAYLEIGDASLADDACQESLLRMIRFIGQYDLDRSFGAWLRTIVRNCSRNIATRRGRVLLLPEKPPPMSIDRRLDLQRAVARAKIAYRQLSPRQREIFDFCDNQGLTPTQAAKEMDIVPSTARALLCQARRALRLYIADLKPLLEDS